MCLGVNKGVYISSSRRQIDHEAQSLKKTDTGEASHIPGMVVARNCDRRVLANWVLHLCFLWREFWCPLRPKIRPKSEKKKNLMTNYLSDGNKIYANCHSLVHQGLIECVRPNIQSQTRKNGVDISRAEQNGTFNVSQTVITVISSVNPLWCESLLVNIFFFVPRVNKEVEGT